MNPNNKQLNCDVIFFNNTFLNYMLGRSNFTWSKLKIKTILISFFWVDQKFGHLIELKLSILWKRWLSMKWISIFRPSPIITCKRDSCVALICEAGATFDNSFFDNCFIFLRQLKNRSFLGVIFLPVTGWSKN